MAHGKVAISKTEFDLLIQKASLTLNKEEKHTIRSQLNEAIEAIKVFDELNLVGVPALNQPNENTHNVWRADLVEPSLSQEAALSQAKSTYRGFFVVKAIF